jgi:trk system potassium uptake protein
MTTQQNPTLSSLRQQAQGRNAIFAALAYAAISVAGALLLTLSLAKNPARDAAIDFVDALFISTSAVSTTGLSTLDTGTTFSFAGQLIILLLIQIGGVGYMAVMSFAFLTLRDRLSPMQSELTRAGFGLNGDYAIPRFLRIAIFATIIIEAVGAVILGIQFAHAGNADPVWNGIFHSVSSFCTAGFSLFATSLEDYKANTPVLLTVSVLSYLGAMGFIVIAEIIDALSQPNRPISPTTRIIISVTAGIAVFATIFLFIFEPGIVALPPEQRLPNAFFQAMTASTTVGFNSVPIGSLAPASILVLYLLMFVGASPSGTGGGLKSTTAALLVATVVSSLRGRTYVTTGGVRVPDTRVKQAASTLIMAIGIIFVSVVLLDLTGSYQFDRLLFEVISALGTVGLSMGITSELNDTGKLIVTAIMYIGRVGILLFFMAFARRLADEMQKSPRERDVMI